MHMKKFFPLLLALIMLFGICITGQAAEFLPDKMVTMMGTAYWKLSPNQQYAFFVVRQGTDTSSVITSENILYMDQTTSDSAGCVSFIYLPSETVSAQTLLRGKNCDSAKEVTWLYSDDGTLTVHGSGEIPSFDAAPWSAVQDEVIKVVITDSITELGSAVFTGCKNLATIVFEGDAPTMDSETLSGINATVYYPEDNSTWTEDTLQNYGGNITWVVDHEHSYGEWQQITSPGCETEGFEESVCSCGDRLTRPVDALGHNYEAIITPPTCTDKGYTTHSCKRCDSSYIDTYVDAPGHSFTNYISNNDATCTEDGTKTAKCDFCDEVDSIPDEGSAKGHSYGDWSIVTEATCTTPGQEHRVCGRCDASETREIPAKGHSFTDYASDNNATCDADGTKTAKCDNCDATDTVAEPGTALGHSYGDWTIVTVATCTAPGQEHRVCGRCDTSETKEIPAKGHSITNYISDNNATCDADGTKTAKCDNCDATDTIADPGTALGHSYGDWTVVTVATCATPGQERRECDRCGAFETKEIPAKGHSFTNYVSDNNVTCDADGTKTAKCDNCDATNTIADPGTALGHSYGDWEVVTEATCTAPGQERRVCDRCDASEAKEISAKGHSFTNYVSDNNATCDADGTKTAKCDNCDATDTIADPDTAKDHSYGEWTVVTAPSCTEKGQKRRDCINCDTYQTADIEILGHSYESVTVDPTCTTQGYTVYTCSICQDTYTDDHVPIIDHEWSDWEVSLEATCTERGEEQRTCTMCDAYEFRQTEATGHSFTDYVSDDNATCTEDGTKTAVCDHCDEEDTIVDEGSATGHDWDDGEITEEPAIGAEGEMTYTCGNCGETKTEVIPALPDEPVDEPCSHSSVKLLNQKEATCTSSGYSGDRVCAECQVIIQEGSVTPAVGHSEVIDEAIAPFCTVDGWTEGKHCSVCHTTLVERKVIPATGHNFGAWTETIPATSQSMGEEMRTCNTCFIEERRSIDKLVNPFIDVGAGAYYEAPVLWAVSKGITNGMSPNTFGPDLKCTRNQVVTFLWRAAGSPEHTSKVNPFVDVKESDYFYKAVLWAVEEGITNGMDATHFGSENECTRAQVATFLWRAQGEPKAANKSHPFKDIKSGDYYYEAVLWAVEAGVTNGMSPNTFAPNSTCTRGQIVTFLYRALK